MSVHTTVNRKKGNAVMTYLCAVLSGRATHKEAHSNLLQMCHTDKHPADSGRVYL